MNTPPWIISELNAMSRPQSEHHLQAHCIAWFRWQHPTLAGLLFAIPNGGQRSKAVAGKLRAEGVVAGVADLFLAMPAEGAHGLFIEMKTPAGRLSDAQTVFRDSVRAQGYAYCIVRSLEAFQSTIKAYLP